MKSINSGLSGLFLNCLVNVALSFYEATFNRDAYDKITNERSSAASSTAAKRLQREPFPLLGLLFF